MDGLIEIFLFCGVLCYFFNLRPNNMIDVLSTRLQKVYAKWENRTEVPRNAEPTNTRFSAEVLRRAAAQYQKRKIEERQQCRYMHERALFKIKETEPSMPMFKENVSFLNYCCSTCTPASEDSVADDTVALRRQPYGLNILMVKSGTTFLSKMFNYVSQVCSFKRYDYPMVKQAVLNSKKLNEVIEVTVCEEIIKENCDKKKMLAKMLSKSKNILLQMESKCSDILLKIIAWLLYKVLPNFIQSAVVLPTQIELLKKADDTGLPLIFLPLHRSHLDYTMISFIMVTNNIRNPLIAAGDNLKIPFFGWLLRGLGAFFIKRRIDAVAGRKDILYRTILQTYITESLQAGHNLEFFVEGGRTRTGKPCMPKSGILSIIIDAYMDGAIEDALLIPVAMNYERLVDGNFVREQLGQPKKMETFASTFKAIWSTLKGRYGIVKIDFCQPFSLREMVNNFQAKQRGKLALKSPSERSLQSSISNTSLYGTDVVQEEHRQLVDGIARHVVYDASRSTPIMSTNIVAFLLLNRFRNGCTLDELVEAFDSIWQELLVHPYNRNVAFCGETIDIVEHALDIMGPDLVNQQRKVVKHDSLESSTVTMIYPSIVQNVIELSYYSNTMLLHYIMDSVIVTALYAELQSQINSPVAVVENDIKVYQHNLVERALQLCDILRYEFIFCRPCQELTDVILQAIEHLSTCDDTGIINQKEEIYLEDELWSRRYATNFDDSSDEEYTRERAIRKRQYKLSLTPEHSARMEFLHMILRPLIDTYTCSAFNLKNLVGQSLCERDLVQEVLKEIKNSLEFGIINYGESLCVDPIKNSFKLFEKWNVLECHMQENLKMFCLKENYDTKETTEHIYNTIAAFRWSKNDKFTTPIEESS